MRLRKKLATLLLIMLYSLSIINPANASNARLDSERQLFSIAKSIINQATVIFNSSNNSSREVFNSLEKVVADYPFTQGVSSFLGENSFILISNDLPDQTLTIQANPIHLENYTITLKNFTQSISYYENPTLLINVEPEDWNFEEKAANAYLASALLTLDSKIISAAKKNQKKNPKLTLLNSAKSVVAKEFKNDSVIILFYKQGYTISPKDFPEFKISTFINKNVVTHTSKGFDYKKTKILSDKWIFQNLTERLLLNYSKLIVREFSTQINSLTPSDVSFKNLKSVIDLTLLPEEIVLTTDDNSFTLTGKSLPKVSVKVTLNTNDTLEITYSTLGFTTKIEDLIKS